MGDFKYQISIYNLFDYNGVERHLEKMAAKGWRFTSVGNFFWVYRRAEPAKMKYSVTYIPEASEFDPEPLEKQRDIEAYCEEAGWKKVDKWMQMQIFCSENPDAVPIETDESLRLEAIHKSMKKNFLFSHLLLLLVFVLNACNLYSSARYDWIGFLSNSSRLWISAIWLSGIMLLLFDIGYYLNWLRKARRAVKEGNACPEPKLYRYLVCFSWLLVVICIIGLICSYNRDMALFMIVYLAGFFLIIVLIRKIQEKLKWHGVSKAGNVAITIGLCVLLSVVLVIGTTMFSMVTYSTEQKEVEFLDYDENHSWIIYFDEIPLYLDDFLQTDYFKTSTHTVYERETFLMGRGEYYQQLFFYEGGLRKGTTIDYQIITVKADFLYDKVLELFWEQEFRYSDKEEREKTEYRVEYEGEQGTMYRQYYEGLPVAHEWLVLTANKIVPLTIWVEELSENQMQIIVDKLAR